MPSRGPGFALSLCALSAVHDAPASWSCPDSVISQGLGLGDGALWCCRTSRTARCSFLPGWLVCTLWAPSRPSVPTGGGRAGQRGHGSPRPLGGLCPRPTREPPEAVLAVTVSAAVAPGFSVMETEASPVCSALGARRPNGLWQEVWNQRRLSLSPRVLPGGRARVGSTAL